MDAYDIMHEWDAEAGIPPRSDEDLDDDIPGCIATVTDLTYEEWKERLEAQDVVAILHGREVWGLPAFV